MSALPHSDLKQDSPAKEAASGRMVAVVRAEGTDLVNPLRAARERIPGLLPATLPRQVLIKPNLCDNFAWDTGVTTDARWISVLASELRSIRPDVRIRVIESDAISAYRSYRSCDETFERLGYVAAADEAGVELVNLSRSEHIEIRLEGIPFPVRIPELFLEESYFVSLANLKVHPYTVMTGILKNSVGLLPDADISLLHAYLPVLISGLHRLFPPDFCIIDARVGLEGQGPIIGRPLCMNTVIFGHDALAVDETACRLMGIRPQEVSHLRRVSRDCGRRQGDFEIAGELTPRKFARTGQSLHRAILIKLWFRRVHHGMDGFASRWIDRGMRLWQDPVAFTKSAATSVGRRLHAQ